MTNEEVQAYRRDWQKKNTIRVRMHKLRWYYKNRVVINMMFSKPKGIEEDIADKYYAEKHPQG